MIELSVIIPTYNRNAILLRTLQELLPALDGLSTSSEVIVVNDDKSHQLQLPSELVKRITLLTNNGSGVASARNCGAKKALGKYLLFMDDDFLVNTENLKQCLSRLKEYPMRVYGPAWTYPTDLEKKLSETRFGRYLIFTGYTTLKGWRRELTWNDDEAFPCEHIASNFFPVLKEKFEATGGYDEAFPYAGFEDRDLASKVHHLGIEMYIDPKNVIRHNEADRIEPLPWLERKMRSAVTRKVAAQKGIHDAVLHFSGWRKILYSVLSIAPRPAYLFVHSIPPLKIFDKIYFKGVNLLIGVYTYKGYNA